MPLLLPGQASAAASRPRRRLCYPATAASRPGRRRCYPATAAAFSHRAICYIFIKRGQLDDLIQTLPNCRQNGYDQDPYAKEFGMNITLKFASVEARVLPAPWLKYHDTGKEKDCLLQVDQWNMMNKKMINGSTVNYWYALTSPEVFKKALLVGFVRSLRRCAKIMAWSLIASLLCLFTLQNQT